MGVINDQKFSISACRTNVGLTQKQLASLMGVSSNLVVRWENGNTVPTILQAEKLSEIFGVPNEHIRFGKPQIIPYEFDSDSDSKN